MCVQCGTCVKNCPAGALSMGTDGKVKFDPAKCVQCDTCIHVCPNDSSPRTCEMTPEEVYERVKKQIPFIRGISVSGGECMLQPEFLTELFRLAKKDGLGTLIDSNGMVPFENYPELMEVADGYTNEMVLQNAVYLAKTSKLYEVRAVIVPDLYDTEKSVREIGDFLAPYLKINDIRVKIIAYRPMGVREEYSHFQVPGQDYLVHLGKIMEEKGFTHVTLI